MDVRQGGREASNEDWLTEPYPVPLLLSAGGVLTHAGTNEYAMRHPPLGAAMSMSSKADIGKDGCTTQRVG